MSDDPEQPEPAPPVYVGASQLPHLMKYPIHLDERMRTTGADVRCSCGFYARTRTVKARDEVELEHRRYHDYVTEQAQAARAAQASVAAS